MSQTVFFKALDDGQSFRIDRPVILVGRNPDCDIILDSKKISRHHCCIARMSEHLVVRDLNSTNGIRINGQLSSEGTIKSGDELTIGNLRFQIDMTGDSPTAHGWGAAAAGGAQPRKEISDSLIERSEMPIPLHDSSPPQKEKAPSKKRDFSATEDSRDPEKHRPTEERPARKSNHPENLIPPQSEKPLLDPDADIDLAAYF